MEAGAGAELKELRSELATLRAQVYTVTHLLQASYVAVTSAANPQCGCEDKHSENLPTANLIQAQCGCRMQLWRRSAGSSL